MNRLPRYLKGISKSANDAFSKIEKAGDESFRNNVFRGALNTFDIKKIFLSTVILIVFYLVGILGMISIHFRDLIFRLTPWVLAANFLLLLAFHEQKIGIKTIFVFITVYMVGLSIEMVGVSTHAIFGHYFYGQNLGVRIFDTPLIIGLNWLLLVYLSSSVIEKAPLGSFLKVLIGAAIMVVYDLILEQIASVSDMWYWKNDEIPLRNFIAWFLLSILFHSLFKLFNIKTQNKMAWPILLCQFVFLLATFLFI